MSIEHASNTDSADIPDAGLTIQVGNVESYNPTNLSPEPEPEITPNTSSGGSSSGSGSNSGSQEGGNESGNEQSGDNEGGNTNPDPTPTPGQSNISINLNITNNSGKTISLDGDVVFVLGNPDVYGNYYGWEGVYNRTDHLSFNTGALTLGSGESRVVTIRGELGNRSPLNPALLTTADRPRNILLYVGGNSEIVLADNMDSGIVFQNGESYNINITQ